MRPHRLTTQTSTAPRCTRATASAIFGRSAMARLKIDREVHRYLIRYCGVKRGIPSCLVQTGSLLSVLFCCSLSVSGSSPAPALTQTTELLPPNPLTKLRQRPRQRPRPRRLPRTDASVRLFKFQSPHGYAPAEISVSARRISTIRDFNEQVEVRDPPLTNTPRNRERADAAA